MKVGNDERYGIEARTWRAGRISLPSTSLSATNVIKPHAVDASQVLENI